MQFNLESLESRTLLANFTAASATDLIASINAANSTPGRDAITLEAGKTFSLVAVDNPTHGGNGLPVIKAGELVTIIGNGAIIERGSGPMTPAYRLFDVAEGASLTIRNLTLQKGLAVSSRFLGTSRGGAIYNQGSLRLDRVIIRNNTAQGAAGVNLVGRQLGHGATGGGVYSRGGDLYLSNCTLKNNRAIGGDGLAEYVSYGIDHPYKVSATRGGSGHGGALFVAKGNVSISNSTLSGNLAQGGAGGLGKATGGNAFGGAVHVAGGTLTLRTSAINRNTARGGNGGSPDKVGGENGQGVGGGVRINVAASAALDARTASHIKRNRALTSGNDIFGSYSQTPF